MQLNNGLTLIVMLVGISCVSQNKDTLVVDEKKVVIFRLSEEEFLIHSKKNQAIYELDSDFGVSLGLLRDELDKRGLKYVLTTRKHVSFLSAKEEFYVDLDSMKAFYGVIFYDGRSNPIVSVGAYPLEYYLEILDK